MKGKCIAHEVNELARACGKVSVYLSRSLADRWGTTVDFTTSFLCSSRFSAFRSVIFHSRPVHTLILSSHNLPRWENIKEWTGLDWNIIQLCGTQCTNKHICTNTFVPRTISQSAIKQSLCLLLAAVITCLFFFSSVHVGNLLICVTMGVGLSIQYDQTLVHGTFLAKFSATRFRACHGYRYGCP